MPSIRMCTITRIKMEVPINIFRPVRRLIIGRETKPPSDIDHLPTPQKGSDPINGVSAVCLNQGDPLSSFSTNAVFIGPPKHHNLIS